MKLYLISQDVLNGYDTYDSAVVAAPDEQTAQSIHPAGWATKLSPLDDRWVRDPGQVKVMYLGVADPEVREGVICASFNAG